MFSHLHSKNARLKGWADKTVRVPEFIHLVILLVCDGLSLCEMFRSRRRRVEQANSDVAVP